jgi:toxin HigB-1
MIEHAESCGTFWRRLDAAIVAADMDLPGFRLHPLKGKLKGYWAVTVRAKLASDFSFCRDLYAGC